MKTDTGGQACPIQPFTYPNGQIDNGDTGRTLLDHFAGLAMQAYITTDPRAEDDKIARYSYTTAVAMVAEKRKREESEQEPKVHKAVLFKDVTPGTLFALSLEMTNVYSKIDDGSSGNARNINTGGYVTFSEVHLTFIVEVKPL